MSTVNIEDLFHPLPDDRNLRSAADWQLDVFRARGYVQISMTRKLEPYLKPGVPTAPGGAIPQQRSKAPESKPEARTPGQWTDQGRFQPYTLTAPVSEEALLMLMLRMGDPDWQMEVETATDGYRELCKTAAAKALRESESAGGRTKWAKMGVYIDESALADALMEYVQYDYVQAMHGQRKRDIPELSETGLVVYRLTVVANRMIPGEIDSQLSLGDERITTQQVRDNIADVGHGGEWLPAVKAALADMEQAESRQAQLIYSNLGKRLTGSSWALAIDILTRRANFRIAKAKAACAGR